MERVVIDVLPDGGQWKVKPREGQSEETYGTKNEAIEHAREMARGQEPSQIVIRKRDGKIEKEYTYGDDPPEKAG